MRRRLRWLAGELLGWRAWWHLAVRHDWTTAEENAALSKVFELKAGIRG